MVSTRTLQLATCVHTSACHTLPSLHDTYIFFFFCRNTKSPNVFSQNKKTYSEFSRIISPIKKSLGLVGNNRQLLNSWRIPEECRWPFTFSSRNPSRTLTKNLTEFLQNSRSKLLQLKSKNLKTLQPMWARPYDCFLFQGCQIVKTFWWGQVYMIIICPVPIRSGGPVECQNCRLS